MSIETKIKSQSKQKLKLNHRVTEMNSLIAYSTQLKSKVEDRPHEKTRMTLKGTEKWNANSQGDQKEEMLCNPFHEARIT